MITGPVVAVVSHWTDDGSRIVTEATVASADGPVVVSVLGGTVDDLTMRTFPSIVEPLVVGMQVELATHAAPDLLGTMHEVIDAGRVLAYPEGFVRTGLTKGGHYLYWETSCVDVKVAAEGTKDINGDNEFPVVDASIATWNDGTATCSYLNILNQGTVANAEVSGADHVNLIKFRDVSWCRPATKTDPARCYPDAAAGLTTATYVDSATNARDGAIVDADVELNGLNFALSVNGMTLGTSSCLADLQNTLTHELGHLQGLEHTCLASTDPPRTDGAGNPVPACSTPGLSATITEATMYPFQTCGETKKSTLEADDVDGICTVYPIASDPKTCNPSAGCCEASSSASTRSFGLLAMVVGLVLTRRRVRMRA